jgi:hypothetical protein
MQCITATPKPRDILRDQPIQDAAFYSYRSDQGRIGQRQPASCPWLCADKRGSRSKEQVPSIMLAARLCPVGSKVEFAGQKAWAMSWRTVAVRSRSLPVRQRAVRSCMESYVSSWESSPVKSGGAHLDDRYDHRNRKLEECLSEDSSCLRCPHS